MQVDDQSRFDSGVSDESAAHPGVDDDGGPEFDAVGPDEPEDREPLDDDELAEAEATAPRAAQAAAPADRGRQRDAARTRARVLEAAERVFARHGFEAARVEEIGRLAGVSRGTPGYCFGSKEELYRAVMEELLAESRRALARVEEEVRVGGGEPWHLLARYVDGYVDFLASRPAFVRLVQWESVAGGPFLAQVAAHFEALGEALRHVLAAGAARLRPVDPTQLMLTIVGAAWLPLAMDDTVLPLLRVDAGDATFVANRKRHLTELILHGLVRVAAPGAHSSMSALVGLAPAASPSGAPRGGPRGGVRGPGRTAPRAAPPPTWRLPGGE
ncbi:MAG TPA: TetR/AcrR family transcriptional regulator [Gemmatimonadales bacterium]|nr:TetR/AcrR family transcriptional regulator [Gemmatimonadales bacterium]